MRKDPVLGPARERDEAAETHITTRLSLLASSYSSEVKVQAAWLVSELGIGCRVSSTEEIQGVRELGVIGENAGDPHEISAWVYDKNDRVSKISM